MARRQLESWFWQIGEDVVTIERRPPQAKFWEPKVDVYETEQNFVVRAELAGVEGDDIQVHYIPDKHCILIAGTRREPGFELEQPTGCHMLEIYYGEFEREIPLPPVPVRGQKIRARFQLGILLIQIPKASAAERKITLNVKRV